jgi:hypothetical protein
VLYIHRLDVTWEEENGGVSWVEGRAVLDKFWLVVGVLQVHLVQQSGGGKVQRDAVLEAFAVRGGNGLLLDE